MSRGPVRGVEQLGKLLGDAKKTLCSPDVKERDSPRARQDLAKKLRERKVCPEGDESPPDAVAQTRELSSQESKEALPWRDMLVIGPSTSTPLQSMVSDLATRLVREIESPQPADDLPPPHFYSSTATAYLGDGEFSRALERAKSRPPVADSNASPQAPPGESKELEDQIRELKKRFDDQIVRLTTTDDKLANALVQELTLRLGDQTPWQLLVAWWKERPLLCDDTIVIVGEGDTQYARFFREHFVNSPLFGQKGCGGGVEQVSYLRGLDGVLPTGIGAPAPSAPQQATRGGTDTRAGTIGNILPDQATLERADGRSQYDYLRRLGEYLIDLDRRKRQEGARGVTAIGVLGSDTYDKLLVLDALREHFPRAVFFAADLDARLLGREALRSTRNLVVASAYGLKLHPRSSGRSTTIPRHLSDRNLSLDTGSDGSDGLGCTKAVN